VKHGIKKDRSRIVDKILEPAHRNCYERKRRRAAERAINIFLTFMRLTHALIPQVHHMTGITETDLRRWKHMVTEDPEWRPWLMIYGEHRRIFTQFEEISVVSFMLDNLISLPLIFTDSDLREVVTSAFLPRYDQSEDEPPAFQYSSFIKSLKLPHAFTSSRIHYKWRSAVTEERRQNWIQKIQ
jgi:hypothetical protein